jgi:hypothetical protein
VACRSGLTSGVAASVRGGSCSAAETCPLRSSQQQAASHPGTLCTGRTSVRVASSSAVPALRGRSLVVLPRHRPLPYFLADFLRLEGTDELNVSSGRRPEEPPRNEDHVSNHGRLPPYFAGPLRREPLFQRAVAALRAISRRSSADSFAARARPPFAPPFFPPIRPSSRMSASASGDSSPRSPFCLRATERFYHMLGPLHAGP